MEYSEKDMEQAIVDNLLLEEALNIQVLENQYQTDLGIIDILAYRPEKHSLVVIELKKGAVDENAVGQIMRYMAAISELIVELKTRPDVSEVIQNLRVMPEGILIGASATPGVKAIVRNFSNIYFIVANAYLYVQFKKAGIDREPGSLDRYIDRFLDSCFIDEITGRYEYYHEKEANTELTTNPEE